MQRIGNIEKWKHVPAGSAVAFAGASPRRVRLDVNTHAEVALTYADGDGKLTPLAVVKGRDVIEFRAYGEFSIVVDGGDLWFYTIDGERLATEVVDAVSFAKIIERRPRNPEVELMNYMMRQNMRRMMEQQAHEFEQLLNRRDAAAAAAATQSQPPRNGSGAGKQSGSAAGSAGAIAGDPPADGGDGKPVATGG